MAIYGGRERHGGHTERNKRQLFEIRRLTQELIKAANESERSDVDREATTPQDLAAVRTLRDAQRALRESMQRAMAAGLESDAIRTHGIDRAVSQTILVSDLARYLVSEILTRD